MKTFKKLLIIISTSLLLCGCKSKESADENDKENTSEQTSEVSSTPSGTTPSGSDTSSDWDDLGPGIDVPSTYEGTYYDGISDSLRGTDLLNALNSLNSSKISHYVTYDGIKTFASKCDVDPNSPGRIVGFYDNADLGTSYSSSVWNREHVWPDSRGGNLVEKDAHMTRPCSTKENSKRGSKGFGKDSFDPGYSVSYYRGMASRIIFYCAIANKNLSIEEIVFNRDFNKNTDSAYKNMMGTLSDMLEWNLQYLPTTNYEKEADNKAKRVELNRNNVIENDANGQGNRNPFVDHPDYACKIWGNTNDKTRQICGY